MILNKQFFENLNIEISDSDMELISQSASETLNDRIVDEVIDSLGDEKLPELLDIQKESDEDLMAWLQSNVPDLDQIIKDEVAILLGEVAEKAAEG